MGTPSPRSSWIATGAHQLWRLETLSIKFDELSCICRFALASLADQRAQQLSFNEDNYHVWSRNWASFKWLISHFKRSSSTCTSARCGLKKATTCHWINFIFPTVFCYLNNIPLHVFQEDGTTVTSFCCSLKLLNTYIWLVQCCGIDRYLLPIKRSLVSALIPIVIPMSIQLQSKQPDFFIFPQGFTLLCYQNTLWSHKVKLSKDYSLISGTVYFLQFPPNT